MRSFAEAASNTTSNLEQRQQPQQTLPHQPQHTHPLTAKMPQDMPPTGGYEAVQYKRNIPVRGLKPAYYLLGMGVVVAYGWRQLFVGNRERIEYSREKAWARIHLIPLLQAEEDRDQARRYYADQAREKQLLGGNTEVYHADRFVRPTFAASPEVSK